MCPWRYRWPASHSSKVVGAMRAFSLGNSTLPAISVPSGPDHVGTSLRRRNGQVARIDDPERHLTPLLNL
jgi:hypothetical protein